MKFLEDLDTDEICLAGLIICWAIFIILSGIFSTPNYQGKCYKRNVSNIPGIVLVQDKFGVNLLFKDKIIPYYRTIDLFENEYEEVSCLTMNNLIDIQ